MGGESEVSEMAIPRVVDHLCTRVFNLSIPQALGFTVSGAILETDRCMRPDRNTNSFRETWVKKRACNNKALFVGDTRIESTPKSVRAENPELQSFAWSVRVWALKL